MKAIGRNNDKPNRDETEMKQEKRHLLSMTSLLSPSSPGSGCSKSSTSPSWSPSLSSTTSAQQLTDDAAKAAVRAMKFKSTTTTRRRCRDKENDEIIGMLSVSDDEEEQQDGRSVGKSSSANKSSSRPFSFAMESHQRPLFADYEEDGNCSRFLFLDVDINLSLFRSLPSRIPLKGLPCEADRKRIVVRTCTTVETSLLHAFMDRLA